MLINEKKLIEEAKKQELLKDIPAGFYQYKIFNVLPVDILLLALAGVIIFKRLK